MICSVERVGLSAANASGLTAKSPRTIPDTTIPAFFNTFVS
jgi:hypothetical protein